MIKKIENAAFSKNKKEEIPDFSNEKIVIKIIDGKKKRRLNSQTPNNQKDAKISAKELLEQLIAANQKIENYNIEIFDPLIEFQKLAGLSKEQRRKKYQEFKEKLYAQRYGWAQCQALIEHFLENDPDLDKNLLLKAIEIYKNRYGFCEWQIKKAEMLLNYYYHYRQNAKNALKNYSDKLALVRDLTNIDFPDEERKNIDVSLGLMNVDIFTNTDNALKIYYQTDNPITINTKIKDFHSLGFTQPPKFKEDEVLYTVINLSKQPAFDKQGIATKIHEWQHLKNAIFEKLFSISRLAINKKIILDLYIEETFKNPNNIELRTTLLKSYLKRERQMVLERVKDEIFAHIEKFPLEFLNQKFFSDIFTGKNPAYNFVKKVFKKELEDDELYQNLFHQFFIEDYPKIIENASQSFFELVNFIRHQKGESIKAAEKARAFLMDKPLTAWPKVVKRFIEIENKSSK
ncbi:MAG: hypothetical protein N2692_02565 [Patescibacteria group bacterium]|jgi:hypothetical protein|nr:hypothetical protein [Patescibacteria group bacterium]